MDPVLELEESTSFTIVHYIKGPLDKAVCYKPVSEDTIYITASLAPGADEERYNLIRCEGNVYAIHDSYQVRPMQVSSLVSENDNIKTLAMDAVDVLIQLGCEVWSLDSKVEFEETLGSFVVYAHGVLLELIGEQE